MNEKVCMHCGTSEGELAHIPLLNRVVHKNVGNCLYRLRRQREEAEVRLMWAEKRVKAAEEQDKRLRSVVRRIVAEASKCSDNYLGVHVLDFKDLEAALEEPTE